MTKHLIAGFAILLFGCSTKIRAGDPCTGSGAVCDSSTVALACYSPSYKAVNCSGPKGCTATASSISCDEGPKNVGDSCFSPGTFNCDTAKTKILNCNASGVLVADMDCSALGQTCVVTSSNVTCQ